MFLVRNRIMEIASIMLSAYLVVAALAASSTIVRNYLLDPQPVLHAISVSASAPELMRNSRPLPPLRWNSSVYFLPPSEREAVAKMERSKRRMQKRIDMVREKERKAQEAQALAMNKKRDYTNANEDDPVEEEEEAVEQQNPTVDPAQPSEAWEEDEAEDEEGGAPKPDHQTLQWEPNVVNIFNRTTSDGRVIPYLVREFDEMKITVSGTVDFSQCWDWNTKAIYVVFVAIYSTMGTPQNEVAFADVVLRPPPPRRRQPEKIREILTKPSFSWSQEELDEFNKHLATLRSKHDVPSLLVDPYEKHIYLNEAIKYQVSDYYFGYLPYTKIEIKMRYQVMSYSGYAPLIENTLGGHIVFDTLPRPEDDAYII